MRSSFGSPMTSSGVPVSRMTPLIGEQHLIGNLSGELDLVRDDHQCPALDGQVPDHRQHLADELGVQR